MKLIVLLKQVPDTLEVRLKKDLTLDREFVAQIMNPADESALEWAIRMREMHGGTLTALTMGPQRAESVLRDAISRGADNAVHLTDPAFAGADTLITAQCLKKAINYLGGADVIACGRRSADGETGQVGPMTASLLNIGCVVNAIRADVADDLTVKAEQLTESGIMTWRLRLPCLIAFCEWSYKLRLPSLSGIRKARTAEICRMTADDLELEKEECGLRASPTRVIQIDARPAGTRPCRMIGREELPDVIHSLV